MSTAERLQAMLLRVAEESDLDATVDSYSGRSMYGAQCISISSGEMSGYRLALLLVEVAAHDEDDLAAIIDAGEPRTDSMGRGSVFYWPSLAPPSAEARFRTSEMDPGESSTRDEMFSANPGDDTLARWLMDAQVGDTLTGIVSVERIS